MRVLVVCRLHDPVLRRQIHGRLENLGLPLTNGVFECDLGEKEWEALQKFLRGQEYGEDGVVVYRLCAACQRGRREFGAWQQTGVSGDWLII